MRKVVRDRLTFRSVGRQCEHAPFNFPISPQPVIAFLCELCDFA